MVQFNSTMLSSDDFFDDYKAFGSSVTTISPKQFEDYEVVISGSAQLNSTNISALHNGFVIKNGTRLSSIEVFLIIQETEENKALMSFSWECLKYSGNEMVFQLYFDESRYVSSDIDPDMLVIRFND